MFNTLLSSVALYRAEIIRDVPWKELDSLLDQFLQLLFRLPKRLTVTFVNWSNLITSAGGR